MEPVDACHRATVACRTRNRHIVSQAAGLKRPVIRHFQAWQNVTSVRFNE